MVDGLRLAVAAVDFGDDTQALPAYYELDGFFTLGGAGDGDVEFGAVFYGGDDRYCGKGLCQLSTLLLYLVSLPRRGGYALGGARGKRRTVIILKIVPLLRVVPVLELGLDVVPLWALEVAWIKVVIVLGGSLG